MKKYLLFGWLHNLFEILYLIVNSITYLYNLVYFLPIIFDYFYDIKKQ